MLRNLLLLVEPTPSGEVAKEMACQIASEGNCGVTALQIHDTGSADAGKGSGKSPRAMLAATLKGKRRETTQSDGADELFETDTFPELNVSYTDKTVSGLKYAVLSQEAEGNDLTILGRDGNVGHGGKDEAKELVNLMLEYRPRPVIITPPESPVGRDVLISYDSTPGSSRAVQFFVFMGLANGRRIHVVSANRKRNVAATRTQAISEYLKRHGVEATQHAVDTREEPQGVIADKLKETGASLLVAGAYGSSGLQRSLFGSVSDYLIYHSPVPLFTCQ